jgi:hypothetical protein
METTIETTYEPVKCKVKGEYKWAIRAIHQTSTINKINLVGVPIESPDKLALEQLKTLLIPHTTLSYYRDEYDRDVILCNDPDQVQQIIDEVLTPWLVMHRLTKEYKEVK